MSSINQWGWVCHNSGGPSADYYCWEFQDWSQRGTKTKKGQFKSYDLLFYHYEFNHPCLVGESDHNNPLVSSPVTTYMGCTGILLYHCFPLKCSRSLNVHTFGGDCSTKGASIKHAIWGMDCLSQ